MRSPGSAGNSSTPRRRAGTAWSSPSPKCGRRLEGSAAMRLLNVFSTRVRALHQREAVLGDIDEEMRLHIDMETEANMERGMQPAEARRAAQRSFGNLDRLRESAYDVRGGGFVETLLQD